MRWMQHKVPLKAAKWDSQAKWGRSVNSASSVVVSRETSAIKSASNPVARFSAASLAVVAVVGEEAAEPEALSMLPVASLAEGSPGV